MLSTRTYSKRFYGCTFYRQEKNYAKAIRKINEKIVMEYTNSVQNNLDFSITYLFVKWFNKWSEYLSNGKVLNDDYQLVEDISVQYIEHLNEFFRTNEITEGMDTYAFNSKISGYIIGHIKIKNEIYNLDFSYKNIEDTLFELDYYNLNFFLYNNAKGYSYNSIIYMPLNNSYYYLKYNSNDYTMNKGFLDYNINNQKKRPGKECLTCNVKNCKPRFINSLDRLKI